MVFGYLILISTDFLRFYFSFFSSGLVWTEKIYQTMKTLFDHISNTAKFVKNIYPSRVIFSPLYSVGGNVIKLNTIFRVWYIELQ